MEIIFFIQVVSMCFMVVTAPQVIGQTIRSVVHDRGYSVSYTDAGLSGCVCFLYLHGLPQLTA